MHQLIPKALRLSTLLVVVFVATHIAAAESKKSLNSAARITQQAATKIALLEVPNGKLLSAELGQQKGKQVWLFGISMPGTANIAEVQVDARTGAIVANAIASPAEQAKQRAAAKRKKKQAGK